MRGIVSSCWIINLGYSCVIEACKHSRGETTRLSENRALVPTVRFDSPSINRPRSMNVDIDDASIVAHQSQITEREHDRLIDIISSKRSICDSTKSNYHHR